MSNTDEIVNHVSLFGYISLEETHRLENGVLILGCISKEFNKDGILIGEKKTDTMCCYYPDKKMTTKEALILGAKI